MKEYLYKPNYLISLSEKLKIIQDRKKQKKGFFIKIKELILKRKK
jgi:hypothetical protein